MDQTAGDGERVRGWKNVITLVDSGGSGELGAEGDSSKRRF